MITKDLLVIGGGINGAGIARDAAGRGLSVLLCEQDDLAGHTSSASTKLIHGGLRYLEQYDFRLVRHALTEREVLLRMAPHIIWPLRFVLPYHKALRPKWLIRLGLFLYDHIGGRKILPKSKTIDLLRHPAGKPLKDDFSIGFEYSDCWVQDARLVVLNAMDAENRGAQIMTRTRCVSLQRNAGHWCAELRSIADDEVLEVKATALVNAAGPWVEQVIGMTPATGSGKNVRLIKGSHIVVPRLFEHDYPYIFQHGDGRVLFAIPFERDFTLLGTTDHEVTQIHDPVRIDEQEISYICDAVDAYLGRPVTPADVIWSYSGIRPLYDNAAGKASRVTRDYVLDLNTDAAPMLSVFGGKVTTFRELAERSVEMLKPLLGNDHPNWTADSRLPGGGLPGLDFQAFLADCRRDYAWLPERLLYEYARNYGTRINRLLFGCSDLPSLGRCFGGRLYEREVVYLMQNEFARTAADILWRRTKQGLLLSPAEIAELDLWINSGDDS